ncbi:hypothetical protein HOK51_11425 [Candidatus Woesearchaeota archaeon]|nr:hypothetical protein [Candidatus Woesearchaeota archaeon]MBT6520432.1 hypothetical protein [Candidatus Woesearchaeota archaeon]MBT7367358.1 hypothetical protein [Candidatus Woesearchaeota archaeon]
MTPKQEEQKLKKQKAKQKQKARAELKHALRPDWLNWTTAAKVGAVAAGVGFISMLTCVAIDNLGKDAAKEKTIQNAKQQLAKFCSKIKKPEIHEDKTSLEKRCVPKSDKSYDVKYCKVMHNLVTIKTNVRGDLFAGNGFYLNPYQIITASHVSSPLIEQTIRTSKRTAYDVGENLIQHKQTAQAKHTIDHKGKKIKTEQPNVKSNIAADVAVIEPDQPNYNVFNLKISTKKPAIGMNVTLLSDAHSIDGGFYFQAEIERIDEPCKGTQFFYINRPSYKGNSGGILVDQDNAVLGIIVAEDKKNHKAIVSSINNFDIQQKNPLRKSVQEKNQTELEYNL